MDRFFENDNKTAYLDAGIFTNKELLNQCVLDVIPLLQERPEIIVFGKVCNQNRNIGFFSDKSRGYNYSRKLMASTPLTPSLSELLTTINNMFGSEYNGVLVNEYKDGNNCIGAHSDDETGLDNSGVVAISYGAERIFRIRDKENKTIVCDTKTNHCGIIKMGGGFQKLYTHEIPVQKKIKESRISFTFRKHLI
jgi:alkylated DNA repair dioxygenase AlkB